MSQQFATHIVDHAGRRVDIQFGLTDYLDAAENKMTLRQHYANKFRTTEDQDTAFTQIVANSGIRLRSDPERGIQASTMSEIFNGRLDKHAGTLVRGTGDDRQSTPGRFLFAEIMMALIEENLRVNKESYIGPWENAIAMRSSVNGPRLDQPLINVNMPEGSKAQTVAQLAEAPTMVSISLSGKTYTIPTKAISLEIADQALQATTIDLVGITLAAQARGERIRRIEEDMVNIISGDTDYNITAVPFVNMSTFDSAINSGVPLTDKGLFKFLVSDEYRKQITHILTDAEGCFALRDRVGAVKASGEFATGTQTLPRDYSYANMGVAPFQIIRLPTSIVGANRFIAFDSSIALHEITNISASYSAIENFALRRATGMRWDYGMLLTKLRDEAFQGGTLAA